MSSEVRDLMKLFVEIGNEYKDRILEYFEEDITKYSLALLVRDVNERYGFYISQGRIRFVEEDEADRLIPNCTVVTTVDSDFLVKMINSEDWEKMCRFGYNVGKITYAVSDKRYFKHGKNLLKLVKILNDIVTGKI